MVLSNIKDEGKQFHKATQSKGPNQWRSIPEGDQAERVKIQRDSTHKKTQVLNRHLKTNIQMYPSQWDSQNVSMQHQNQSETINTDIPKQFIPYNSDGQLAPMQFQRDHSRMNTSHRVRQKSRIQFQNQPETMKRDYSKQMRRFISGDKLSTKQFHRATPQMRSRNTTQYYNQKTRIRTEGERSYWSKLTTLPAYPNPKQALRQIRRTRPRRSTTWSQWIPPHLVTDEYYDSDSGKMATDSREKHNWVGWDGGDFMHFYHPNDPKYNIGLGPILWNGKILT